MKRVLKTRSFCRWMRKTELTDAALCGAVKEMEAGLIDADLGGGVFKKRVPLPGRGKRGSARTLLATNREGRWIFLVGFEKNERDNITPVEQVAVKHLASKWLRADDAFLDLAVHEGELEDISHA